MGYQKLSYDRLCEFSKAAFNKFGFDQRESEIITDVLLLSDLYGIESHGVQRMSRYYKAVKNGTIEIDKKPSVVFETPVSAVIDGHNGMGQVIAYKAMTLAIEKAKKSGVAFVTARNSNHYGIAGYYAKMASDQGLIGISCTNSAAIMVPTFGKKAMLGSNPIAVAMPADPCDFLFDASTTVVTRGKLEVYNKAEKPLPIGWAIDKNGLDTSDAADVLDNINSKAGGGILPLGGSAEKMGGHKGYGNAMLCELFSAIISLGTTSNATYEGGKGGICHGFVAVDPRIFGDAEAIKKHLSDYLDELRQSPKAAGQERIYTHGEKEVEAAARIRKEGVPVNDKTVVEMKEFADHVGLDFDRYFL